MDFSDLRKYLPVLCIALFVMLLPIKIHAVPITLIENGTARSVIVIGDNASLSEVHGANELQMFLQMISGGYIPIYKSSENPEGRIIFVGKSEKLTEVDPSIDFTVLGDDGFVIRTKGDNLILAGGELRGSMYAVYTFLEEQLGCRWYTSTVSHIPKLKTITIGALDETQKPAFDYREPFWRDAFNGDWAARNKCNGASLRLDIQRGGPADWPNGHTFYPLIRPDVWFDDHPEYYSFWEGRRRWEYAQLCLTNPELMKLTAKNLMIWMKNRPGDRIFEVSQNDWSGWCECHDCSAIDEREEAHSGTVIEFVNAIADRTKKEYPENLVSTFAYKYTEKAPKFAKPRENVMIRLCNIIACDVHPLGTCPLNARFRESMAGWEPITNKMYVWDYVTNFKNYLLPLPNLYTVVADIPWMREHGVDGLFEQGCYTTERGSLAELQAYLEAKLLWNTERNAEEIIDDFLNGYFGKAAAPIKKYIELLHKRPLEDNIHSDYRLYFESELLSRELADGADRYFDEAMRLADNRDIANRIDQWRLSIRYMKLGLPIRHHIDGDLYKPVPEDEKYADMKELEAFFRDCKANGVTELFEGHALECRYNQLRANNGTFRIVTLENPHLKIQVVPGMGGRILQITHKKSGTQLLAPADVQERYYPGNGGFQVTPSEAELLEHTVQKTRDGQKLIMEGYTFSGSAHNAFRIRREIVLPADSPEIQCVYTLEAESQVGHPRRISSFPVFSFAPEDNILIGIAGEDGVLHAAQFSQEEDSGNRLLRFTDRVLPNGSVSISDKESGLGIIQEFESSELDYCTIGMDEKNRSMVRLDGRQRPLKKGDTMTLHHTLKIITNAGEIIRK